jgi:hypothetical protein
VVFTLPAPVVDIAYQNKAVIYDLLFKAAADTTLTIAADSKHLGARIGITAVLHTWGSAMTHCQCWPRQPRPGVGVGCDQAVIGDGDAVGVTRQISEHGLRTAERALGIDDPFDLT